MVSRKETRFIMVLVKRFNLCPESHVCTKERIDAGLAKLIFALLCMFQTVATVRARLNSCLTPSFNMAPCHIFWAPTLFSDGSRWKKRVWRVLVSLCSKCAQYSPVVFAIRYWIAVAWLSKGRLQPWITNERNAWKHELGVDVDMGHLWWRSSPQADLTGLVPAGWSGENLIESVWVPCCTRLPRWWHQQGLDEGLTIHRKIRLHGCKHLTILTERIVTATNNSLTLV